MPAIILLLIGILVVLIGGPLLLAGVIAVPSYLLWASGGIRFAVGCLVLLGAGGLVWVVLPFIWTRRPPPMMARDGNFSPDYLAEMEKRTQEYKRKNGLA